MCKCRKRHHRAAGRDHIDVLQCLRILPKAWVDDHDNKVLIERGVRRRDLPLAKGVIKDGVQGLRADAKARGCGPVDDQIDGKSAVLGVTIHVGQLMNLLH
jgi:hypothetical protein